MSRFFVEALRTALTVGPFFVLVISLIAPASATESRYALVIGNSEYASSVGGHLDNPEKDADLIAKSLQSDGFEVVELKNGNRAAILSAVTEYAQKLGQQSGEVLSFFYYSGHGMSRLETDENYLIPINITDLSKSDVWHDAISMNELLRELSRIAPNAAHFVVFDACRSVLRVPFKTSEKGFNRPPETPGMFIAFSTSPQAVASDSGTEGGPYATSLAKELQTPGIDHLRLFQNVKRRVFEITHGAQRPWENDGLVQSVYFKTGTPPTANDTNGEQTSVGTATRPILPAGPPIQLTGRPDTFCADIKNAMSLAAGEFAALRTGAANQFGWGTNAKLDGFPTCRVSKGKSISLSCEGPPSRNKAALKKQASTAVQAIKKCIGSGLSEVPLGDAAVGLNDAHSNTIIVATYDNLSIDGQSPSYHNNINIYSSAITNEAAAVPAAVLPPPEKPIGYCEDLKATIGVSEQQFNSLLARLVREGTWESRVQFKGWDNCRIYAFGQTKRRYLSCSLESVPNASAADKMIFEIASDVKACLADNWVRRARVADNGRLDIEFWSPQVASTVELRATEDSPTWELKLEINGPREASGSN